MPHPSFRHAALVHAGEDSYLDGTLPFIRAGLEAEQPVLVMVPGRKVDLLRDALGSHASEVHFADMADVGANPARIIPAWQSFVSARAEPERRVRGVGEPIWRGRSPDELVECQRHEALLNVAFEEHTELDLLCPYDEHALDDAVIEEALRTHPILVDEDGEFHDSDRYPGADELGGPFGMPLPEPPAGAARIEFGDGDLEILRAHVAILASGVGLSRSRREDLVLAVNELASNSVRHGGGRGTLRLWAEPEAVVAEVSDRGQIDRPLAGREHPRPDQIGGHGLWLVNQLTDLMQMRTFRTGSVVRVHVRRY